MAKLPEEISHALHLAEEAKWPVSARNGKIVITAPDGMALTIGTKPNDESMKTWRSTCRQYNLVGDGPAMTPDQQKEEEAMATATKPQTKTPAQLAKEKEIAEAQAKAAAAAAGQGPTPGAPKKAAVPVVTFTAPEAPVVTPKVVAKKVAPAAPAKKADPFPPFSPYMLTVKDADYSPFRIDGPDGKDRFFCGNCWEKGERITFKGPQGLASHRGFVHAAFALPGEQQIIPKVPLPEQVETALELLRGALTEELTGVVDDSQVKALEAKVEELNSALSAKSKDLESKNKELAEAKSTLDDTSRKLSLLLQAKTKAEGAVKDLQGRLDAAIKLAESRGEALDEINKRFDEERKMLLARFEKDLAQFRSWANELAPVKAVGMIVDVVERYLTK